MNYETLEECIKEGLSTYQIADKLGYSQTNVRYWLRKYGLNTNHIAPLRFLDSCLNGRKCTICNKEMVGKKRRICNKCRYTLNKKELNANTQERQKRVSKERKLKLIEMSGGGCSLCGYKKNYSALQFHHLNPENKLFNIDARKLSNTNWSSILLEWGKCQLLCSNCHSEIHNPSSTIDGNGGGDGI